MFGFRKKETPIINNTNNIKCEIDYEKLAQAISKANLDAYVAFEKGKKDAEIIEKENIIKQREAYINEKTYEKISCGIIRKILLCCNKVGVFFRILFVPKNKIELFSAIDGLISTFTSMFLFVFRILLYLVTLAFLISALNGSDLVFKLVGAFTLFVFAQLFRIAQYEVERIKEPNYLLALFVGILTIVSLVVSIIGIFLDCDILDVGQLVTTIKDFLQNIVQRYIK